MILNNIIDCGFIAKENDWTGFEKPFFQMNDTKLNHLSNDIFSSRITILTVNTLHANSMFYDTYIKGKD